MRLAASVGVSVEREVRVVLRSVRSASVAIQAVERAEIAATPNTETDATAGSGGLVDADLRILLQQPLQRRHDVVDCRARPRARYFGMFAKRE
jgi:hypothetical protein